MEQDINENIKILERMLKIEKECLHYDVSQDEIRAIEHLIKAYKELEEENKIIKGNYYTLCADIQMVTSELGFPEDTIIADEMVSMIKENYIPVSLVEETIEELKNTKQKFIKEYVYYDDESNIEYFDNLAYYDHQIDILQELLEKRK